MSIPNIQTSGHTILDVTTGREALNRHFENYGWPCPEEHRVPVILYGYLDGINSQDDGDSQEFTMVIEELATPG
jgi:hypothetical protein